MNSFMSNLSNATNYGMTWNGELSHKSTMNPVYDMFATGGAYRKRSDEDCILLFKNAYEEDKSLALKCLFYLRDVRGGQGERRFFRTCFHWLCDADPAVARKNLINISEYGRWDDLIYIVLGTAVESDMITIVKNQLVLDIECKAPSLLAKWMPSENASSYKTKVAATRLRTALGWTHRQYRKGLSELRKRINVLERLMSENRWDEIEFDKIPSKAGLVYRNAFARRDIIAKKYESFAKDTNTKVNAEALYPYEIVSKVANKIRWDYKGGYYGGCYTTVDMDDTEKAIVEKYWENQKDYLNGNPCKMMCVVDTSGSMTGSQADAPINVAIGLGMYCAERIGGPFKNHYISFSSRPQLIKIEGVDFADKVRRIYETNLCQDTNLEATFDLLKSIALKSNPDDIPETIVVISDMQIDYMSNWKSNDAVKTGMERLHEEWATAGLKMPKLVYWNVNAQGTVNILDLSPDVSYVSGCSPVIFESVLTGKTGWDLCLEKICSERYNVVSA